MKKFLALIAGAFLLLPGLASAQNWRHQARVSVGFEFVVGETVLPAGNYWVDTAMEINSMLKFTNTETNATAFATNIDIGMSPDRHNRTSNLVFVLDANGRHVLHQVFLLGESHGHDLVHKKGLTQPK